MKRCRVTKSLLEAQIWRWLAIGRPEELKRRRRIPLSVRERTPLFGFVRGQELASR